jgi:hypothetical protein
MAGCSVFAPPCMVAGPNGLDLKKSLQTGLNLKFVLKID